MIVAVTGATGLIGRRLVAALLRDGHEVRVLSRGPARAEASLGTEAHGWSPLDGPAPAGALAGCDAVVHLAGEKVAQRWTASAKRAIRESRVTGTRNLVAGLAAAEPRPPALVSASAVGYYGAHGDERLDERTPAGKDFLADVCVGWEREAQAAATHGVRAVSIRNGVVLDRAGGALAKMLPPFRAGIGGPVAGGRQYVPFVHIDDLVSLYVAALTDDRWQGPVNGTAPEPVTNAAFSRALGRALHRPAIVPVPGFALRVLYGEMAEIVTEGQRAIPARALSLGHEFGHPEVGEALHSALSGA